MSQRYFVESPIATDRASLVSAEAHHLSHVMRAAVGDEVTLFDGVGAEFTARVAKIGRSSVDLEVLSRHEIDRELPFEIVMGVALPKGDRQRWLIEKCAELGVTRIVPLQTTRSVAQPVEQALERLRRTVIEASKQCGRNRLMTVAEPLRFDDYLSGAPHDAMRLIAHPVPLEQASSLHRIFAEDASLAAYYLAVGPEGGFSDEETSAAASAGWQFVSLGSRILRIETAALALAAMIADHGV
jgi:16S rRNA (uracil1498-N3)-methyltransferase